MSRIAARRRVTRITAGGVTQRRADFLSVEEPLEIRVHGTPLAVTMRTPGHDVELAAGFLVSEGVIHQSEHFARSIHCAADGEENTYNVLDIGLAPGVPLPDPSLERNFYTTSSCGLCGKASIDAVRTQSRFTVGDDPLEIDASMLITFPDKLREQQRVFDRTGGLHAAALFDGATGEMLVLREDVGRHNAVDKVVGWALQHGHIPARSCVLMVSGRASFELTQKALMAGIPMLAAVSAPSSLAADLAEESGMTLVGFLRGDSMVVYARPDRITNSDQNADADAASAASTAASPDTAALTDAPQPAPFTSAETGVPSEAAPQPNPASESRV
ncbi:formate dehydrogenase accessory sulfurtransferase FdhD [Leucobacter sp. USHLN153]|uniref:formate dehydrogenase accessory sulfurtransferase FdhD n=1 Tax=Leucobacter sp. USHLN153 TaxID=3081268 RepID=UPI003FA56788